MHINNQNTNNKTFFHCCKTDLWLNVTHVQRRRDYLHLSLGEQGSFSEELIFKQGLGKQVGC